MIFVIAAALGIISARWLGWYSLVAVAIVLALAVGIEGATEGRNLFKTLKRALEINAALQGAYLATVCALHSRRLLGGTED
jgi:hypothetical protein